MERKLNAIHKTKSRSQPDLFKMGMDIRSSNSANRGRSTEDELYELCALSGLKMDIDVFKIIVDLLHLNVNPNTLLEVLKRLSNQQQGYLRRDISRNTENVREVPGVS